MGITKSKLMKELGLLSITDLCEEINKISVFESSITREDIKFEKFKFENTGIKCIICDSNIIRKLNKYKCRCKNDA